MEDEQIHGLTLRQCAEIMAKDGALKAQHGERAAKPLLLEFLAEQGIDESVWANSWNGWWARMESDPSGQLHAKFATIQQELTLQTHMADVPDASQDAKEGVTLDTYAKVMAGAAGGGDMQALVAEAGLEWGQWQRAQTAWNTAMGADVNHHLTTQYGQLYAKHTPGFQQQMQGQVAAAMAAEYAQREAGRPDEPEEEYTFADSIRDMEDAVPGTRWTAGHLAANAWDIGDRSDGAVAAAGRRSIELCFECLGAFDDFSVSDAETAASDLAMFGTEGGLSAEQAEEALGDIQRALNRSRERLATHEAAFEPIRDKAVPERVKMQSLIQDYTSMVETLEEIVEEWDPAEPESAEPEAPPAGRSAASSHSAPSSAAQAPAAQPPAAPSSDGGLMDTLKALPIIGDILRALGL
ncbi:MAG: hypothetical protein AB8H79_26835 [Myxococcota bacterium]